MTKHVVIVGGGLAGLSTACKVLGQGSGKFDVTIVEKKLHFGGQVASWKDAQGRDIETGIHLLFPWYANMVNLYQDVGKPLPLVPSDGNLYILDGPSKSINVLEGDHESLRKSIGGIMKYPRITRGEKAKLLRFLMSVLAMPMSEAEQYDSLSVADYLARRGMSKNLIRQLEIEAVTIQGLWAKNASAASFLKFIKMLYASKGGFNTAFLNAPIGESLVAPLTDFIAQHGGTLRAGGRISRLHIRDGAAAGVNVDQEYIAADVVVFAVPGYSVPWLLPPDWRYKPPFKVLRALHSADVVTLQFNYDRRVFPDGNVYISNRRGVMFDAVCDKAWHWNLPPEHGSIVQVLIDSAGPLRHCTDKELEARALKELAVYFPSMNGEVPIAYTVLRHEGVYSETRPRYWSKVPRTHHTPIANLYLAGDYTDGPYHYGMESAVASGVAVAREILKTEGIEADTVIPPKFPWLVSVLEKLPL